MKAVIGVGAAVPASGLPVLAVVALAVPALVAVVALAVLALVLAVEALAVLALVVAVVAVVALAALALVVVVVVVVDLVLLVPVAVVAFVAAVRVVRPDQRVKEPGSIGIRQPIPGVIAALAGSMTGIASHWFHSKWISCPNPAVWPRWPNKFAFPVELIPCSR